jgi:transposase
VTEERLRFVARLLEGEAMTDMCRGFGISRKIGYKIFNRYQEQGLDALCDRSRRPVRYANQLPQQIERLIVDLKRDKPHWGARKIRELLVRKWLVSFMHYDLGYIDLEQRTLQTIDNPFGTRLSPMS